MLPDPDSDKYKQILGLEQFKPTQSLVCFLPLLGEFGWYLLSYTKRFHLYNHNNKIICCKRGHEGLFPTASHFFYDWQDISDDKKAGIIEGDYEDIKERIKNQFNTEDILFISPSEITWENKHWFHTANFIPQPKNNLNLKCDVVITPRNRQIDPQRNWSQSNWQEVVNYLASKGFEIGVIGNKETTFDLKNIKYKSYDFEDVEGDLNIIHASKISICLETGTRYLIHMCRKPMFFIGKDLHGELGADLHRDHGIYFEALEAAVGNPILLAKRVKNFLQTS